MRNSGIIRWLEGGLAKPGKTQTELAKKLGRAPSAVTNMLKGKRELKAFEVPIVKDYLELDDPPAPNGKAVTKASKSLIADHPPAPKDEAGAGAKPPTIIPGSQLVGERDLPVYGVAQGGSGATIVTHDPVDWIARPGNLARVKDGYGIIVVEDSMAPEFEPGDIAYVNPNLPPIIGATCVFRGEGPDGAQYSCIKRLRRATADAWHVREWNSADGTQRDFTLKRSEWQFCHVTVGNHKRR